jgi:hypothetical protein
MRLEGEPISGNQFNKERKTNGFEPFEVPESEQQGNLFINSYHGHLASRMELNRNVIERTLKIAHLDGQVFLTSFVSSRNRSLDANSDGSVSQKKTIFIGEDLRKAEENENAYSRVISIPQGWRIEINDQRMMEELMGKNISADKREKIFIGKFNYLTERNLEECILREKFSSIKDRYFKYKLIISLFAPAFQMSVSRFTDGNYAEAAGFTVGTYILWNALDRLVGRKDCRKNIDHIWEYAMPYVEVDKAVESLVYLNAFGNNLVKKKQ